MNYVSEKEGIWDLMNAKPITLKETNNVSEIIVVNYPGSYTSIRKAIAVAKAIAISNKDVQMFGLSIFDYFDTFSDKNFFVDKYMFWSKDLFGARTNLLNYFNDNDYVSNVDTEISTKVDCSSIKLIQFIKEKKPNLSLLTQKYYDKWLMLDN